MKKLFTIFVFALLFLSFVSFGFVNAQEDTSLKVDAELNLDSDDNDSDNSGSSSDEDNSGSKDDSDIEVKEETEIEVKDGETRIKERREIRNSDGTRTREEFEIRTRTELTDEQKKRIFHARNRLRIDSDEIPENCVKAGVTLKCEINGTRTLTIRAGNSNNTIIQIKDYNTSTKVTLYKEGEEVYGVFRDNETRKIILPDEARERIKTRIKAKLENETLELDEEGKYELRAEKEARLFALFKVREKIRANVDAETGEVLETRNPWWGFLARDVIEEEPNTSSGTFLEGEVPEDSSDEENIAR